MSQKKIVPPPMKKSVLLKLKLKMALGKVRNAARPTVAALLVTCSFLYMAVRAPELHGLYLREAVGSKVYMIQGEDRRGGGTGFALEAGSGKSYVVTNAHVCEGAVERSKEKDSVLVVDQRGATTKRKILEISNSTDLCIIEGMPGVEGLKMGNRPSNGEKLYAVGHPLLRPMSVSSGEVVGKKDIKIPSKPIESEEDMLSCSKAKNEMAPVMTFFGPLLVCLDVTRGATQTTITVLPGNSGSPAVDFWGNVSGVVFAMDGARWAYFVSLNDLEDAMAKY